MFDNTVDLAENKLMLLYIFNKIKFSISNNQITQIVLENNLMNYFILQQYITELISAGFLEYTQDDGKSRLIITQNGSRVLELFQNRIPSKKTEDFDNYLNKQIDNIKREVTVTADYTIEHKDNFIVNLKAVENNSIIVDIKLNVASNKQARDICQKWKSSSSRIYSKLMELLISE
jgi:predicted transcriptional regulator